MHRQPDDLRRLLSDWQPAAEAAQRIRAARRIFIVGIGTSYHAALVGEWLLRAAGLDARAVSSFDFSVYPGSFGLRTEDAVIVMAHSGVKQYSSRSLELAASVGATRISIGSLTAEHAGSQQVLRTVEREKSAAFTASHLAAMTVLAQIAIRLGTTALGSPGSAEAELMRLPEAVSDVLAREDDILSVARDAAPRRIYAIGAGPNAATALEAVIKVREAAQGWIDALPAEQFLHGPLISTNPDDCALIVNAPDSLASDRIAEITRVLHGVGARIWLIGEPVAGVEATVFPIARVSELTSPLLAVVPVQLFAYHMATIKGINPDVFRRDEPRYAAALSLIKL